MIILAVESSCDDMSWALVRDGAEVLGCEVFSQEMIHAQTGGVVPEVAARQHIVQVLPVLDTLLTKTGIRKEDIDAIAVTAGPGLLGSLLVGISAAQTLALLWEKPLIPVHHIEGHIYANWLERSPDDIQFPLVVLTVSGGHNDLYYMPEVGSYELLGHSLDDAAGEAFDKVARMLGLGYPGGPAIERFVKEYEHLHTTIRFPKGLQGKQTFDYSFSGLKSEIRRTVEHRTAEKGELSLEDKAEIATAFQSSVVEVLAERLVKAARDKNVSVLCVSGGVSASSALKYAVEQEVQKNLPHAHVYFPVKKMYSTDNAAMIGAAAYFRRDKILSTQEEICALTPHLSYTLGIS